MIHEIQNILTSKKVTQPYAYTKKVIQFSFMGLIFWLVLFRPRNSVSITTTSTCFIAIFQKNMFYITFTQNTKYLILDPKLNIAFQDILI